MKQTSIQHKKTKTVLTYLVNNQAKIILGITLIAYALSLLQYVQAYDIRTYNSDLLYLPTLFQDLTEWGGQLFEWRLTPAPYFFPDMLLYFPLAAIIPNWQVAFTLSLLLQLIIFTTGWALLGRQFFKESKQRLTYAAFVFATVALLLTLSTTVQIIQPQHQISIHFGVMLMLPYILGATLKLINHRFNFHQARSAWVGLIVLLGLLALSDAIVYVQIILPLLLAIFLLGLLNKIEWKAVLKITISVGIMMLLVYLLRLWLIKYPPMHFSKKGIETIGRSFIEFITNIVQDWQGDGQLVLIFLLLALGIYTAVVLVTIYLAVKQKEFDPSVSFLGLFFLVSVVLTITAVISLSLFLDRGGYRYIYPLTVLPIYMLMPIIFYILRYLKIDKFVPLFLSLLIIGTKANTITQVNAVKKYQDYYPPLAACVDNEVTKRGLHSGATTYWDAKYISMLSKSDVKMLQISSAFSPYVWINNPSWYARFPPQFVLFNPDNPHSIDMERIINLHGYPQEIVDCDTRELWVYNRPEDTRFQSILADNPMSTNWCPSTVSANIPAYVWHTPKSVALPAGATLVVDNIEGIIAEGQLFEQPEGKLLKPPEGQYLLDVRYEYEGLLTDEQTVAELFVGFSTFGNSDEEIDWHKYQLPATDQINPITFDLNGNQNLWIRLHFGGDGIFTLHQFQIQKHSEHAWPQLCR